MGISYKKASLLLFILILLSGCTNVQKTEEVNFYFTPTKIHDFDELSRIRNWVVGINEKKKIRKKSPDWLSASYSSLKIKRLDEVPEGKYVEYAKFVDPGDPTIYIVIHPAYYPFFINDSVLSSNSDLDAKPLENIVERFCARVSFHDRELRVMQEQERSLRDFLEIMSSEKKLLILVLPRDYKSHLSYGYLNGLDEYMRYINEVTGMSESVLYVESLEYNFGYIGESELAALSKFIKKVGARKIMLGGEFAGRCLDNAYWSLMRKFDQEDIYLVPEITAIAYRDVMSTPLSNLLTKDRTINFRELSKNLRYSNKSGDISEANIRHLFIYDINTDHTEPIN